MTAVLTLPFKSFTSLSHLKDLRALTKPLIAIYNLDKEVSPREGEKLQLEFHHYAGGIVQMTAARLVQAAKRVKSDDSNGRERSIRSVDAP